MRLKAIDERCGTIDRFGTDRITLCLRGDEIVARCTTTSGLTLSMSAAMARGSSIATLWQTAAPSQSSTKEGLPLYVPCRLYLALLANRCNRC